MTSLGKRGALLAALISVLAATLVGFLSPATAATAASAPAAKRFHDVSPLVIAHRGASGYRPEHTLAAYKLAIDLGADYIEPDLVSTKDGVLVARHENEISGTTDVAKRPEFAGRKTTKVIDGVSVTGWFTEDFTLAELRTLRAIERVPEIRPGNTRYNGKFAVPTLDEVLALARTASKSAGRTIGVYAETKHPTYFDSIGLSLEEPLLADLKQAKMTKKKSPVFIQSFEDGNLRELAPKTDLRLVWLVDAPAEVTKASIADAATFADGLGVTKDLVLPRNASGATGAPSSVVTDAHANNLFVHVWTLRDENRFMATNFRRGTDPNAKGDAAAEAQAFFDAGVDGVFADYPDTAVAARAEWWEQN